MPLMSSDCVVGAFQRKIDLMKPATPVHVEFVGETSTKEQYVLSPHTSASHALSVRPPPFVLAKPHGSLPSATEILALALCCPRSLANAVDPMPSTMHCPVFGSHRSSPL
jgi:hypothetical protein